MNVRRYGSICATVLLVTTTGATGVALAASSVPAGQAASPASPAVLGRALYQGEADWAQAPRLAGVNLPPQASACARCHGRSGEGGREAGVTVPPLAAGDPVRAARWLALLASGRSSAGQPFEAPMPQYRLTTAETEALQAYLGVLGTDREPVRGVTAGRIALGVLVPDRGPRAAVGQAVIEGMRSHFDELGRQGGVYGRQVDLVPLAWNGDRPLTELPAWLRSQRDTVPVLALAGSLVGEVPASVERELAALRLPLLANLGPALRDDGAGPDAGWVSRLMPSVQAQLAAARPVFDEQCPARGDAPLELWLAPVPGLEPAVRAALDGQPLRLGSASLAPAGAAPRRVLSLLPAADTQALRQTLRSGDCLWTLALFSGASAPTGSAARELLTFPSPAALPQVAGDALGLWQGLGRLAGQLTSEILARAGLRLQPEALVLAQTTLKSFEPVPGVAMELARTRRHALSVTTQWRSP